MRTRAVILAGGEGSRLGTLTAKRTKPAVPFAGKYRIIDFTLSNCVNSGIFDVMILAQYRPHSLIEHIGSGGAWDLNRDFTGGVRIYSPYKARGGSDWYLGTADAVQQNFLFIKSTKPDLVLILSGDHIYRMNYRNMIEFHQQNEAELTIAAIPVPMDEASRFGVMHFDENYRIKEFIEKSPNPPSNMANMGVYLFNREVLDRALWEDHTRIDSTHDFGKDILPRLVAEQKRVFAFPFEGYWMDVGTVDSYWSAHMDLLASPPSLDLNDRSWVIHTRAEERPPVYVSGGASVADSLICEGCVIEPHAQIEHSILSPGVHVETGAFIRDSVILTDTYIRSGAVVECSILDKRVTIGKNAHIGKMEEEIPQRIAMIGKNSLVPENTIVDAGAVIATDVVEADFLTQHIRRNDFIQTRRLPNEI
jgi:glucose-1-phosphate adenylyltransferase